VQVLESREPCSRVWLVNTCYPTTKLAPHWNAYLSCTKSQDSVRRNQLKDQAASSLPPPLQALSALGPSGLRHTHLLEAADVPSSSKRKAIKEILVRWVLQSPAGTLPSWSAPWIAGANLIPLKKPTGRTPTVAVCEVLRRLTSKVLHSHFTDQLDELLAQEQMGVRVRGATE